MAECVSIDAFKLFCNVDAMLTILLNLADPRSILQLDVFLEYFDHGSQLLFIEHMTDGFALNSPCLIGGSHSPISRKHRTEDFLDDLVL